MNPNIIYILLSIFIIIIIVLIVLLSVKYFENNKDDFTNLKINKDDNNNRWNDMSVPSNLKYNCFKSDSLKPDINGTSLASIETIQTQRHPIYIEYPFNWYNTQ